LKKRQLPRQKENCWVAMNQHKKERKEKESGTHFEARSDLGGGRATSLQTNSREQNPSGAKEPLCLELSRR